MPILISDKIEFKTKTAIKDKEGQYLIKGSIQEEDITTVNIYAPNTLIHKANAHSHKRGNQQ